MSPKEYIYIYIIIYIYIYIYIYILCTNLHVFISFRATPQILRILVRQLPPSLLENISIYCIGTTLCLRTYFFIAWKPCGARKHMLFIAPGQLCIRNTCYSLQMRYLDPENTCYWLHRNYVSTALKLCYLLTVASIHRSLPDPVDRRRPHRYTETPIRPIGACRTDTPMQQASDRRNALRYTDT